MQAGDRHSRGSVYIGALVALAILGVMLSQFGVLWATQDRRAREADLLAHGNEIRRAIGAYYDANPAGQYPKRLDELVLDPRQPVVARYLRRAWRDPLPKGGEWGIVPGPDNGIVGVYSQAPRHPASRGRLYAGKRRVCRQGQLPGVDLCPPAGSKLTGGRRHPCIGVFPSKCTGTVPFADRRLIP